MELFDILGRAAIGISAPDEQTFSNTDYDVLTIIDTTFLERGNVAGDIVNNSIVVNQDGLYDITFEVNAYFQSGNQLDTLIFINGLPTHPNPISIQGRGANKPVSTGWILARNLIAGDFVDIRMRNGDNGNMLVNFLNLAFEVRADS